VKEPRVYYGEQMSEYAIVGKAGGTDAEYDRPVTETKDEHVTYQGKGGVRLDSTWRRLLYSIKYAETKFLLADAVNDNSKILTSVIRVPGCKRSRRSSPSTATPIRRRSDGRIVWIIDGYTTSANYPYSKRVDLQAVTNDSLTGDGTYALAKQQINYIRNSVKATVDAYDGT
jgi:uncharacterized membrane protein (UPF0182 family)